MEQYIIYTVIFIVSLLLGAFIGKIINKGKYEKEQSALNERNSILTEKNTASENTISQLQERYTTLQQERENMIRVNTQQDAAIKNLSEKLSEQKSELEKIQDKFTKEFENLANKILEEKSTKFTEQNKENLKNILNPLQDKIKGFEDRVEKTHKESIDYHAALRQQIKGLQQLNEQMSKDALNLTKALKGDSKTQGNWGELVLERVLEKSGLEKGREYIMEQSFSTEEGNRQRLRPDVIINLPDGKKMIIDSKVSLTAYEKYVNSDDETEKKRFLKEHIFSLNKHVSQLSEKKYERIYEIESPDFVLLFVPVEPAFAIAVNEDNNFYNKAFEQNIVIVTPTTLLATLRTIDSMWQNEKQQRNALNIANEAGKLYDQFVLLTDDLIKVGNQLKTVQGSYDSTMKKLTGQGNLIRKVEKLKKLGAKAGKNINDKLLKRALEE
ncbi:MAG: DNA recombination protein RmuC [Flavobacteriales bacterium]|nr:MAG: DNA recombination protein RmuC [Flavobacteriales bacterium]